LSCALNIIQLSQAFGIVVVTQLFVAGIAAETLTWIKEKKLCRSRPAHLRQAILARPEQAAEDITTEWIERSGLI
jgi:hypothetical protein